MIKSVQNWSEAIHIYNISICFRTNFKQAGLELIISMRSKDITIEQGSLYTIFFFCAFEYQFWLLLLSLFQLTPNYQTIKLFYLSAKQEESAVKRIKLEYDEMKPPQREVMDVWEIVTNKDNDRIKYDHQMLLHAIRQGIKWIDLL